jgi:hypothetical protein
MSTTTTSGSATASEAPPPLAEVEVQGVYKESLVSSYVSDILFAKKQFIVKESELDSDSTLAKKTLKALNMQSSEWDSIRELVRRRLNRRRNNAQSCVRDRLASKLILVFAINGGVFFL